MTFFSPLCATFQTHTEKSKVFKYLSLPRHNDREKSQQKNRYITGGALPKGLKTLAQPIHLYMWEKNPSGEETRKNSS